jgi:TusA-related sulfurtransferase
MPSMFIEHKFLSYIQAIEPYHSRVSPDMSLRRRLQSIFLEKGSLLKILIDDETGFINEIVDTRNYYTHHSKKRNKNAIVVSDQFMILVDKLKFIIEVIMLLELGIKEEKIKEIISRNNEYEILRVRLKNKISKSCRIPWLFL